jgi:autotransporter translocation and assembly factor TamB
LPTNPALDVLAEREISGVAIEVRLRGTLERPEIGLTSRPILDEGDILALLVFGQAMNELGTADRVSLTARAGAIAASAIANPLTDSVARALDLDQFEVRAPDGSSAGASVIIGRQLNDRVFIGFRHDFGDEEVSQVSFEYRLNEYQRLITSFAQGAERSVGTRRAEAAGIDLIFVIRR